jgi:hypothetical protein
VNGLRDKWTAMIFSPPPKILLRDLTLKKYGEVIHARIPGDREVRFTNDGKIIGFLNP